MIGLAFGSAGLVAQTREAPAQLVDYVRGARNAGLPENDILKEAEQAGWPPALIQTVLTLTAKAPDHSGAAPAPANGDVPQPSRAAAAPPKAPAAWEVPPKAPAAAELEAGTPAKQPTAAAAASSSDYQIGAGDVLQVSVWKEPDASVQSTVVRPDGKISLPLVKEVAVAGLTISQAETFITQQLTKFITAPDVTVVVAAINSKKIYLTGAVKKEGPIAYTYRMTVLQALSEAGGLTDYAKRKKIYILHDENGRQFTLPFDYDAVLRGQRMELNIYLTPGDTVVVPH